MRKENRPRGNASHLGWLIILASFAVGGYFWHQWAASLQKERIASLEGLASRLKSESVPLKFMVLSRDSGEIKARVKLYDLSGRELAVIEKSWPGTELYVDMLLVPVSSRSQGSAEASDFWLALPYRIFTDELKAASGTLLFDSYDSGGFPEVLGGPAWSEKERAVISAAFASARRKAAAGLPAADSEKGAYGSAVHELSKLSSFEPGIVYKVVCRVKGGVEIMED